MITLKRLEVNNFKGLRSATIAFPEHGTVLIEGHNEAGKSTLFEAVYVALYGKPLVGEDAVARRDEVIQYGQSQATVRLIFSVGQQELIIERIFERGKSQQAILAIQRSGVQPEVINRVRAVDERILQELGNLDGDNLRNSCFVEQKELGRIEALSLAQREQAIQKLLGLERLTKLMDQFKFRREQERQLALAESYLKLAQLQAGVHAASVEEVRLAEHLDAVKVAVQVKHLSELEQQRDEVKEHLAECATRAQKARERLERCAVLKGYLNQCDQANRKLEDVSHARHERDRMARELERLARIEQVELPEARTYLNEVSTTAEAVVQTSQARKCVQDAKDAIREAQHRLEELERAEAERQRREDEVSQARSRLVQRREETKAERQRIAQRLSELEARKKQLEVAVALVLQWEAAYGELQILQQNISTAEVKERDILNLQIEVQRRENDVREFEIAVDHAEKNMQQAIDAARRAIVFEALTAWIRLKGVELALSGYISQHAELVTRQQEAQKTLIAARAKTRTPLVLGIALAVLAILAVILGFLWLPAFALAVIFLAGAVAVCFWFFHTKKDVQKRSESLAQSTLELQRLDMQRQAAIQAGGDPVVLAQYEQQLQAAGIAVPSSLEAGRSLQKELYQQLGTMQDQHALQEIAQAARDSHIRLAEQLRQARSTLEESKRNWQLAQQAGDPTEQSGRLKAQAAQQEQIVTATEQKAREAVAIVGQWPTNSVTMQTLVFSCITELRTTRDSQQQREQAAAALIREAVADRATAEEALQQAQVKVTTLKTSDPAEQVIRAQQNLTMAQSLCLQQEAATQPLLRKLNLRTEAEVEPERGRAEANKLALEKQLVACPSVEADYTTQNEGFTRLLTAASTMIEELIIAANGTVIPDLPSLTEISKDANVGFPTEQILSATLVRIRQAIGASLTAMDEQSVNNILEKALSEQGRMNQQKESIERDMGTSRHTIDGVFSSRDITHPLKYTRDEIILDWPIVALVSPDKEGQAREQLDSVRNQLFALRQQERQLTAELQHPGTPLSIEECQQKVDELVEERKICELATKLLRESHDRIARRVLPITERNMQPLLQQLTGGRYRDVRLTPDESNGQPAEMDYRIRVWDPAAGRYVAKNLFSGGTRDQCSLALRLAFALATLPQELGVAPGFIFLDEPLSAFDVQRAQALVELITTGIIAQQFNQVVLISHQHAFDREAFQFHVRMESGQIVESDLPLSKDDVVEAIQL